jgi:DNA polymerase-4
VSPHRKRKSIGNETTFAEDLTDKREIWQILNGLSAKVAKVMADKSLQARTLTLKVRYADFVSITRSKTPEAPIVAIDDILAHLPELLRKTKVGEQPIRLIGVTVSNLIKQQTESIPQEVKEQSPEPQLGLFSDRD